MLVSFKFSIIEKFVKIRNNLGYPSAVRPRLTYSVKKEFDAWEIDVSEIDKGAFFGRGNLRQVRKSYC